MEKNNAETVTDKYIVQDTRDGFIIDECDSLEKAKETVLLIESVDRNADLYQPGRYVIRHGDEVYMPEETPMPEETTNLQESIMQKMTTVIDLPLNLDFPFDYKGFKEDFRAADTCGPAAIQDTYDQAFAQWKDNVDYFASLVLTLSHQGYYHHQNGNDELGLLYDHLYSLAHSWGRKHFTGKDKEYYFHFLD